jgi:hypothetical protein
MVWDEQSHHFQRKAFQLPLPGVLDSSWMEPESFQLPLSLMLAVLTLGPQLDPNSKTQVSHPWRNLGG